jgi:hypothetical protein
MMGFRRLERFLKRRARAGAAHEEGSEGSLFAGSGPCSRVVPTPHRPAHPGAQFGCNA